MDKYWSLFSGGIGGNGAGGDKLNGIEHKEYPSALNIVPNKETLEDACRLDSFLNV